MKNRKGPKDDQSVAAMEIVAMEQRQDSLAEMMKGAREKATSVLFREAGRIEALNFQKAQADFFMLIMLKRVKEAKEYREKLDMTWSQFCESVGLSHSTIDKQLVDLKPFKVEFLSTFANFAGFDFSKIKYLAEDKFSNLAKIHGNKIIYDGQEIVISPENKDEIQAVLEKIESDYRAQLENAEATTRTQKKLIKQKEELLVKQEKDLRKFEKRAEGLNMTPEEDGFIQQMEDWRIRFEGFMQPVEPGRIGDITSESSALMRAAYVNLFDHMRRRIVAAYDTATEMFGADMALEGEKWKPGA